MDGAVGELGEGLVVGHDDKGLTELVAQIEEELVELLLVLRVEGARRLVGQDDGGVVDECTGHGHTLFLTTGEFVGLVGGTVGQSHEIEQLLRTCAGLFRRGTRDIGRNHDVLDGRELGEQLVELEHKPQMAVAEIAQLLRGQGGDINAVDHDASRVRTVEGADDLKQRGLTGSRGADDTDDLTAVDMEVDAFQYL